MKNKLLEDLKNKISDLENNPFAEVTDSVIITAITQLLYKHSKGDLMPYFMLIDKLTKEDTKKEIQAMRHAVQDGIHNSVSVSKRVLEGNNREAKEFANHIFNSSEGNIASIINIAKNSFKLGKIDGHSVSDQWFFEQFLKVLKENKEKYLEGGNSHNWAIDFHHLDYIKLVLKENE